VLLLHSQRMDTHCDKFELQVVVGLGLWAPTCSAGHTSDRGNHISVAVQPAERSSLSQLCSRDRFGVSTRVKEHVVHTLVLNFVYNRCAIR
jgi:hypothetical protein